ncbi:LOW QUALITY PROTEIN: putative G-protein coupled receptor 149 [Rhynchonycteris naso]
MPSNPFGVIKKASEVLEVIQGPQETLSVFLETLQEAYRVYTSLDPEAPENARAVNLAFMSQSTPDIRRKLKNLEGFPGVVISQLLEVAQKVYNNRETLKEKKTKKMTKKPGTKDYHPVQDLQEVNKWVEIIHPAVPNPYTLRSLLSPDLKLYTVLDLKGTFFSIPLSPVSQPIFAFEWIDPEAGISGQLTWTRLPQGFKNSLTLFDEALHQDLLAFHQKYPKYMLLQYVGNLLLAAETEATFLVSYNFYTMHRTVGSQATSRKSSQVLRVALTVWAASLLLSALPLCGWDTFVRTTWGCLVDCSSSYVCLLLFAVYTSAFGLLACLSVPLIHQLLCFANYQAISRGTSTLGSPPTGKRMFSLPDDALGPALRCSAGRSPNSDTVFGPGPPARTEHRRAPGRSATAAGAYRREDPGTPYGTRSFTVSIAQKRFSLILALTKVILWLPMMIHMATQHFVVGFQNLPFESLSFLLTLLATTITPVFVLSKRTHLPCGCIINCKLDASAVAADRKTSFQWCPLCAFQGMVSLQAPTGKTLSLSTYEVSAEGQKITPAAKNIEVYHSKSVGHEPNSEDSSPTFVDTSKIHFEVLEICDNEEALGTVSIISNISQSFTQVRSPSLRFSRKENRFFSCDLGETASYSLFLPTSNPDGDINISIPDTIEAHKQKNSKRQHQERDGYQEEIQLLSKVRKREEESKGTSDHGSNTGKNGSETSNC